MNAKKITILLVFTILLIFSVVSRIFFNDFQDGWIAYEKRDYKTARELWLPLAEQGDPRAQFFLGFMQDMGFGVPEDDKKALKWYQLAAEQGDSRAQLFAGFIYDFGNGVPKDDQKAIKWYQLAAEQGFMQAKAAIYNLAKKNIPEALKILRADAENGEVKDQYALRMMLGAMYEFGQGVSHDDNKAFKWYMLAAEQGNADAKAAIYNLAKKNIPEALKILRADAENGEVKDQYALRMMLGAMYEFGQGVRQGYKEAVIWYQLAAEQGDAVATAAIYNLAKKSSPDALKMLINYAENGDQYAQSTLSMMYQLGLGVPQDNHEAVKWYGFAAEREFIKAKNNIIQFKNVNIPQALKALTNGAENGDAKAQLNLGMVLQFGLNMPKDEKEAAKWYLLAAEQGDSEARSIMGLMYANGQGVAQDDREAMQWYRLVAEKIIAQEKARIYELAKQNVPHALKILTDDAENGIAEAQNYLGTMYANGQGVFQDHKESAKWYRFAAEQGDFKAQYHLGVMHANGLGVPYDFVLAHMWYDLSALQGHGNATYQITSLEKRMSPQQIEQAQEMVRDWKPSE
jgi:TPR repeat protein